MYAINVVKILIIDCVLTLNVAYQQPPEGKALSVQFWRRLESEEVGNQYNRVVATRLRVSDVAKPVVKLLMIGTDLKLCQPH